MSEIVQQEHDAFDAVVAAETRRAQAFAELIEAAAPFERAFDTHQEALPNFSDDTAILRPNIDLIVSLAGLDAAKLSSAEYLEQAREQAITYAKLRRLAQAVKAAREASHG